MRITKSGAAIFAALLCIASIASCSTAPKLPDGLYAMIDTDKGTITISLEYDMVPLAVANFVGLAEGTLAAHAGERFYDGLTFHRVEAGFVVQGGDPAGDGSGGPGYTFPDEFDPAIRHDAPGVVAMANYGPDTNGCQFYITLSAAPALDNLYTAFGRVVSGMDVVEKLSPGDAMTKVTILRSGSAAKAFDASQEAWDRYYGIASDGSKARARAARAGAEAEVLSTWPELETRTDGILSKTLTEGSGPTPPRGALVKVSYKGMLPNGRTFDQSILHGGPFEFELGVGRVITGWDRIVQEMKKGEKRLVAFPPEYAYGTQGVPGLIPPNSFIVFEIELTDYSR
ncbi:MAG: peptidylprolyl isomerase [Spirochaetae bacterium HGW-Spirochaetae-3]|jgi:peptidylprolyl isomerase|nr:MAG: peptidylprolyl isomerase [Spirochaetae bacterium HGW-Spirochaetae-3]